MEIYVHPTCTSCKKAETLLADSDVAVQRRDYFRDRFTREELTDVLARAGLTPTDVLSKRSRMYKELELEGNNLGDDELLDLMLEHPTLLKRPIVIGSAGSAVGYNAGKLEQLVSGEG